MHVGYKNLSDEDQAVILNPQKNVNADNQEAVTRAIKNYVALIRNAAIQAGMDVLYDEAKLSETLLKIKVAIP